MEWTDTLMLEKTPASHVLHLRIPRETMEVKVAQGVSLILADIVTHQETFSALEALRGFRAVGRRVVFCDTTRITSGRQLGQSIVADGQATILVSCGMAGREVAIGARDSGLDLSNVIVCRDDRAACELLSCRLVPGDTVLLLGVDRSTCDRLVERLDNRNAYPVAVAA